jgi:hypothetical protein
MIGSLKFLHLCYQYKKYSCFEKPTSCWQDTGMLTVCAKKKKTFFSPYYLCMHIWVHPNPATAAIMQHF